MKSKHPLWVYALLILGSAICLAPLLWTISTALKSPEEVSSDPARLIPKHLVFDNFGKAWTALPFTRFVLNTIVVAVGSTIGTVFSASLVAYGFARFKFWGQKPLFAIVLGTMMLPPQVTMVPVFLIWRDLHAIDTFWPLILPAYLGGGAFNVFLLRQFLLSIPREMDEAAMLDGAGYLRVWWRILVPLMSPAIATVAIFSFLGSWDAFDGPLIYLNSPEHYTVAIGLRMFQDSFGSSQEQLMAATLIHIVPTILIFFVAQKFFIRGLNISGLGGR